MMQHPMLAVPDLPRAYQLAIAPASEVVCCAATAAAAAYHHSGLLANLRLPEASDAAAPSAVLYDAVRQWLYLLDVVPAHGPIDAARRAQLGAWAQACPAHKVFITLFPDMATYQALGEDIAWETEVWLADAPQHLIHFNGNRFQGPR